MCNKLRMFILCSLQLLLVALVTNSFKLQSCNKHASFLRPLNIAEDSDAASLEDWLYQQGCRKEDCKVKFLKRETGNSPNNNEMKIVSKAKSAIKEGDTLFSLPIGLSIDINKAQMTLAPYVSINQLATGDLGFLALFILVEKKLSKQSKYFQYISTFPSKVPGILSWSHDDIELLTKATTRDIALFLKQIERDIQLIENLRSQDLELSTILPEGNSFRQEFIWAIGIVKSRYFVVNGVVSLLPGLDSISFDPYATNEPIASSAGIFGGKVIKVLSDRSYSIGDDVYLSSGLKSSAECLEEKGFTLDLDDNDCTCEIEVAIDESTDKFPNDKELILQDNNLMSRMKFDLVGDASIGIDPELIRFLRLKLISGKDAFILEPCFSNTVFHILSKPFSKANELSVVTYLLSFCESQLQKINSVSSEEKDKELMRQNSVKTNAFLIAKLRHQERMSLLTNIKALRIDQQNIQSPTDFREYYQERRLRELDLLRPLDDQEIVPFD